ncbi:MAG: B3/4 domain-containing protein [bacterium]|jgi:DNA/RNA-binding domain of Phe-tRNA-synthetase-like protein
MDFILDKAVLDLFPAICIGVVVAEDIDNRQPSPLIAALLAEAVNAAHAALAGQDVRSHPAVAVWRDCFTRLSLNPNKYPSSIEALAKRIAKKPELPHINNSVDLVNGTAVRHLVPMGAHDIDQIVGDLSVRFTRAGEIFTPFGENAPETVDEYEIVYADGAEVRTRKWVWRQGEKAKVTEATRNVFFPIDGFYGQTGTNVRAAQSDLAEQLARAFPDCRIKQFWVDGDSPVATIRE